MKAVPGSLFVFCFLKSHNFGFTHVARQANDYYQIFYLHKKLQIIQTPKDGDASCGLRENRLE